MSENEQPRKPLPADPPNMDEGGVPSDGTPSAADIIEASHPTMIRRRDLLALESAWSVFDRVLASQLGDEVAYDDLAKRLFGVYVDAKKLRLRRVL